MLNLFRRWYERHFSQPGTIEFALVLISAFLIVYYLMWLVGPIVVALCIAYCLEWPLQALQRLTHLGRRAAATIVMLLFCSIVILITVLVIPQIVKQGAEFYNSIISFSLEAGTAQNKELDVRKNVGIMPSENNIQGINTSVTENYQATEQNNSHDLNNFGDQDSSNTQVSSELLSKDNSNPHKILDGSDSTSYINNGATAIPPTSNSMPVEGLYAQANSSNGGGLHQTTNKEQNLETILNTSQTSQGKNHAQNNPQASELSTQGNLNKPDNLTKPDSAELGVNTQEPEHTITVKTISDHSINAHTESASIASESSGPSGMQIEVSYDDDNKFKLTVSDFDSRLAQEAYLVTLSLPEPIPSMLSVDDIKKAVRQVRIQTTAYLAELMRTKLMPSVVNLFTWAVYIIIVPIFTFLMLYNKEQLTKRAVLFILPNNQILMRKFWPSLHQQISGYIRGKIIHIIIISIANSLAFKLLGVNYALLLGVGVGLSVVIPYVGAVIIAIPVVLVAIFQFGFSESLLWVLVIYTVIQLLDSNVLTPMLFSKAMNLDAFSILAAILIFGGLWGFWGVFFAIPLATFIKTIVMQWPNKDVREQQKREHLRLISIQKAEKNKHV